MGALFFTLINNYWMHSSFDHDECECGGMCEGSLGEGLPQITHQQVIQGFIENN